MSEPENHDEAQTHHNLSERDRLAKLRALGREMELRARLDVLQDALASKDQYFSQRIADLDAQIEGLRAEQDSLKAHVDSLEAQRNALAAELDSERQRAADSEAQLENTRLQMQRVLNSRSWKITKPLRAITHLRDKGEKGAKAEAKTQAARHEVTVAPTPGGTPADVDPLAQHRPSTAAPRTADVSAPAETPPEQEAPPLPVPVIHTEPEPAEAAASAFVTAGREAWDHEGTARLQDFLATDRRLAFPTLPQPRVSIIIVLYNKAHLTYLCLESLVQNAGNNYELLLVDNGSTDATAPLLDRLDGARILRNADNKGFGYACMQGAQAATGEFLCFLNNDVVLCPGALEAAVTDFREDPRVGAVGGKLLLSDGRLQEAGSMVWRDGTAWGYGREDDPSSRKYAFRRPVDYCSGALLITPRALFNELGGFDNRFLPAYYEDTDYGFKVWDNGLKVIYEPHAIVHHYESASMPSSGAAKSLIDDHRSLFVEKWQSRLNGHPQIAGEKIPYARISLWAAGRRILFMASSVPNPSSDPEAAPAHALITALSSEGHHVTCVSMTQRLQPGDDRCLPREVELADAKTDTHYVFRQLLSQYDLVWVAGHQSMREFLWHMWDMNDRVPPIVYQPGKITGVEDTDAGQSFEEEVAFCQAADIVVLQSESERQLLLPHSVSQIQIWSEQAVQAILAGLSS